MEALVAFVRGARGPVAVAVAYAKAIPGYVSATWQAVQYFYEPKLAAWAGGIALVCLLLRVTVGGTGGMAIRLAVYGGLFYLIVGNADFRLLFPDPTSSAIIAAIGIGFLWLPVTILGGIIRRLRLDRRTVAPPQAVAGGGVGPSAPFDVKRSDNEKKQTMVIMMTDIVGYSARMEKDEAATFSLLKEHNTIMRRAITTHRGKEIKTIGDAFMVVFASPLDALRCAIVMQRDLHAFNKPRLVNDQLKVRIGVHRGEVIATGKDVFGEGVNIAARMESITEPGGISISADVYQEVKNKVEAGFQSIGTPKMKNIANPPEVFRVQVMHGVPA
jgi:class 3 adenylate cyclase